MHYMHAHVVSNVLAFSKLNHAGCSCAPVASTLTALCHWWDVCGAGSCCHGNRCGQSVRWDEGYGVHCGQQQRCHQGDGEDGRVQSKLIVFVECLGSLC